MMVSSSFCIVTGLLLFIAANIGTGFYIQPDVLFLSQHPKSQYVVADSDLSLSCAVQLRGLRPEDGNLTVPIVRWTVNNTNVSNVFPDAVESHNLSTDHLLRSTLHISHTSRNHTGTYHCNVVDGTDEREPTRLRSLCFYLPCYPYITASNPATVTVLEVSTEEQVVEVCTCSSTVLRCGSLLPAMGLRPILEWNWNETTLNELPDSYHTVLSNGDLALFHSTEGGVVGVFHCIASSGSNSVTLATYTVVKGGDPSTVSLWLVASPSSQVTEDDTFSLLLASSGVCLETQSCVWTRDNNHICSSDDESRYKCTDRVLTVSSASHLLDTGSYCCDIDSESGGSDGTVCIDIQVGIRAPPLLTPSHNDTTIAINTSHSTQLTITCTPSPPHTSHYWLHNGFVIPDAASESLTVTANVSSFGVYQCFAGNEFGFSVATVRIVDASFTNPPGLPQFREIPLPDTDHRPAYLISWQPPSFPENLSNVNYSLNTLVTNETSAVVFISLYSYSFLDTFALDRKSGERISEQSAFLWRKFNDSKCYRHVYFPPNLSANCVEGVAGVSWINSPDNEEYYKSEVYSANGPVPGLYYINITCYLHNDTVLEVGGVFTEEGYMEMDEELPMGTECVFKGAATPASDKGPALCLDPATIFYNSTSCRITAYVEFENSSYVVGEGAGWKEVCLNARGYGFSVEVIATYDDDTTEVIGVNVSSSGGCVSVEVRDNEAVSNAANISLSLRAQNSTGPAAVITVLDDDVLFVIFTNNSYEVVEGGSIPVCVRTDGDLRKEVHLILYTTGGGDGMISKHNLTLNSETKESCAILNVSDNSYVEGGRNFTVYVDSSDPSVDTSALHTIVNISDDDYVIVGFSQSNYEVVEGGSIPVCVRTDGDLRKEVHLILYTTGGGDGMISKHNLTLNSEMKESCAILNVSDNSYVEGGRNFTVYVDSSDPSVDTSALHTIVNISDDDYVIVGFSRSNYEMQAGEVQEVCVLAEGELNMVVTVSVSVNRVLDGESDSKTVELDKEQLVFDFSKDTACLLLNASYAIAQKTAIQLELKEESISGEQVVIWSNQTAQVTIMPAPTEQVAPYVIVISVLVPLPVVVVVCLVCALLLRRLFASSTPKTYALDLDERSMELKQYELRLSPLRFASVNTLFEALEPPTALTKSVTVKTAPDVISVASNTSHQSLTPEPLLEQEEEGVNDMTLTPESRGVQMSLASDKSSPHSSITSCSHHEYIASESLVLYSYPPSVLGYPPTELSGAGGGVETSRRPTENDESGESGMDHGISGMNSGTMEELVGIDCLESTATTSGDTMDLLSDADLSAFISPVTDSGLGMDFDEKTPEQ